MKHLIFLIVAAAMAMTAVSCREVPLDGHLDGQWQIMTVEGSGDSIYRPDRRYFCFYRHTANLTYYGLKWPIGANLTYRPEADSLIIDIPTAGIRLDGWGVRTTTPDALKFRVLHLSRKRLVMLYEDSVTFTLRKF